MDCSSSNSDNQDLDQQRIDVDEQQVVKTLGIVRLADNGVKFYKPDVPDSVKPLNGKLFNTIDDALHFYKTYAKRSGFEARKDTEYKTKDGTVKQKYFVCSREGFKPIVRMDTLVDDFENLEIKKSKRRRKRPSCRCGCLARLILDRISDNKYVVCSFEEEHNHPFVDEDDISLLKSSRKLTFSKKQLLFRVSNNNIGPTKAFKMMKDMFGGFEEVGATSVNCKNFRRGINLFIGEYDAEMVVELLMNKQEYINGFSCEHFTNDDGNLSGLFWADEVAKQNYISFGDVISFDATFRSNKYKMVFVPFTGIDNHHRSVTLAAALLSNETAESYGWLLRAFKKAFGREPMVVVTDQDPAMKIAVEKEFNNSRHRLCMWHIMEKLSTKVGPVISQDKAFKKRICDIFWTDTIEPSEFEQKWDSIIEDFDLHENKWLKDMFELRFYWIPAFYRDQPMSGLMRTTSWSESENHFFGQLTSTTLTLVEFVSHFDTAMDIQRYTHRTNQHKTRYTNPQLLTDFVLEKQARDIYTRTIFYDVQEEICGSITDCMSVSMTTIDDTYRFFIKEIGPEVSSLGLFEVLFTPSDVTLSCSCKRFERYGLVCSHSFYVLWICGVSEFPKKYVSRRWTRDAVKIEKRAGFNVINKFSEGSIRDLIVKDIVGSVEYCIDKLASNFEQLSIFRDRLQDIKSKLDTDLPNQRSMSDRNVISSAIGVSRPSKVRVRNPLRSKNKGERTNDNQRIIPSKERAITDGEKKGRKCNSCGDLNADHDARNCPNPKKNLQQKK